MTFLQFNTYFTNENSIIEYFTQIKYPNGVICPHCGCRENIYHRHDKYKKKFKCNNCNNDFSIFKGTIFENSSTDLRIWFYAINQMLNAKKGISALQLQRDTGVTYKTAWRILNKIRTAMGNESNSQVFEAIVEIDETYVGGKPRKGNKKNGQPQEKKSKRGRGTNKTPVVGIKERNTRKVYAVVAMPNKEGKSLSGKQLLGILETVCKADTMVITDDFRSYGILDRKTKNNFIHLSVKHSSGEYSAGNGVHTNGIESFWALLKRGIFGMYHHISLKHMQKYIDEFCFRMNHKDYNFSFDELLERCIL